MAGSYLMKNAEDISQSYMSEVIMLRISNNETEYLAVAV